MAKSTVKKKKHYKLKKTARRSIAAVFMITAIILAAIPVPEAVADEDGIDTLALDKSIAYPTEAEILSLILPTDYPKPTPPATEIPTYEIVQNGTSYRLEEVFKIWVKDNAAVISDFNIKHNPAGGILKIPNDVTTDFPKFTEEQRKTYISVTLNEGFTRQVNAFFGVAADAPLDKQYTYGDLGGGVKGWIDPNTKISITQAQQESLYMYFNYDYGKEYVARSVNIGTEAGGNQYAFIPFNTATNLYGSLEKNTSYTVNAIGDNAFYTPDDPNTPDINEGTSKANHIKNLNLQIADTVVAIGNEAFRGAATLSSITIGSNVKDIGARAFKDCTSLTQITINPGCKTIGVEAFSGCNSLPNVTLPNTYEKLATGAFSQCANLASVDMSASSQEGTEIGDFAFYNCSNLNAIKFASFPSYIGDGSFAVITPANSFTEIVLPQSPTKLKKLGKNMFDGQRKLKKVTMPLSFGYDAPIDADDGVIPEGFFYKCVALEEVIFPEDSKFATFPTDAFNSVENAQFKVVGPASMSLANPEDYAKPRIAAHEANVPYQYTEKGRIYLELRKTNEDGTYNFYRIDDANQLISFEASGTNDIELEIFDKIGNFPITGIQNGCFDTKDTKARLISIHIYDNSISTIADNTFSNCPKLEKVHIGNTVQTIGANAFLECPQVKKITFSSPSFSHEKMAIGANAFKTNSTELVFQGDIVPNYAPFTWAMSDESVLDDYGKRICYKSNAPQNLTVIQDNVTGLATLVDYPHFTYIDEDNETYKERLIETYVKAGAEEGIIRPIIMDPSYIENKIRETLGEPPAPGSSWTSNTSDPWYKVTTEEQQLYDSIINIVIPAGIQSIDSRTFFDPGSKGSGAINNEINWPYVPSSRSDKYYQYDEKATIPLHGGLFSGPFVEYDITGANEKEKVINGNDRLETVTMYGVKALPDYAFESCENLQKVVLGSELAKMGKVPFIGCTSLAEVVGNQNFEAVNKIIYSTNSDGTKNLVECLPIRGLKSIDEKEITVQSDPMIAKLGSISPAAFKDCAGIAEVDLTQAKKLSAIPEYCFYNTTELIKMVFPDSIRSVAKGAFQKTNAALTTTIPTKQIALTDEAFEHNQGKFITFADSAAWSYAKLWGIRVSALGERYKVVFTDYNAKQIGEVQMIEGGKDAEPPANPVRKGYTFTGWSGSYKNITEDTTLIAQYDPEKGNPSNPDDPNKPTTPTTTTSGGSSSNNGNNGNNSNSENKADGTKYKMTVTNGSGSGDYTAGTIVNITANASSDGKIFDKWTTTSTGVYFANSGNVTTSIVMPKNAVTVSATYKAATVSNNKTNSQNKTTSGNQSSKPSTSTKKTNTAITITKPGFSNTDKANAIVNGSTDNFVVKVTESAEAQAAIQEALLNSAETMDTIKYFPMDISLYDSTGTVKVTDTSGLSVNITMPLPDELKEYGGNNKVASIVDGQLEQLRPKFSTIDQVPCVTFTATHFSPYTIYVDTANLVAGNTQDSNPKTGDGIHPKWFLVIGLIAVSTILFLKKDRRETIVMS